MTLLGRASIALALATFAATACTPRLHLSILIRGGTVITGDGTDGRQADIGIDGDRIVAIGNLAEETAATVIDASGKVVTPGIIELEGQSGLSALVDPNAESYLRQGITTQVIGADNPAYWTAGTADAGALRCLGLTLDWQGFDAYATRLEARGPAFNIAMLTPMSAAPANASARSFIEGELRKGSFGAVADAHVDPNVALDVAASMRGAGTVLDLPWDLVAEGAQPWMPAIAGVGRVILSRAWAFPQTAPATILRRVRDIAGRSSAYGVVSPWIDDDVTLREAVQVINGFVFTSATPAGPCRSPLPPPAYGAFARLFGHVVRDRKIVTLPEAVAHATAVPARLMDLYRRGTLQKDYFADVLIVDPKTIAETEHFPRGLDYVIVNGVITVRPDGLTGARAGAVLRHVPGRS
ncbi:MAG TPA: amidohydrolase family protein [Vicinamibacterales bacterium]|nr:amidohydrolase family protein [Vicinamibacterales bacterium]